MHFLTKSVIKKRINEKCTHMPPIIFIKKRCIYVFEIDLNKIEDWMPVWQNTSNTCTWILLTIWSLSIQIKCSWNLQRNFKHVIISKYPRDNFPRLLGMWQVQYLQEESPALKYK